MNIGFVTLLYLCAASPVFCFAGLSWFWSGVNDQQPLLSTTLTLSSNYSVGFSLASSYGSAAVVIDHPNGEKKILTWVVYGDLAYRYVMERLSLDSSRHLAWPYNDMEEFFMDQPRVLARTLAKKAGLPATPEVGILATVIKKLRSQIESDLKITVSDGTFTTTHLVALYRDDIFDICDYAGFWNIVPKNLWNPVLWETSAAYTGYGFGLCEHWQNDTQCDIENGKFPDMKVLAVHYSRVALTSSLADVSTALYLYEGDIQHVENFKLGSDAKARYKNEEDYWHDVKGALLQRMHENPWLGKPEMILLTGDMIDGDFIDVLKEAMKDYIGLVPPIFFDDPVVVAAKGAAELRRRGESPFGHV